MKDMVQGRIGLQAVTPNPLVQPTRMKPCAANQAR